MAGPDSGRPGPGSWRPGLGNVRPVLDIKRHKEAHSDMAGPGYDRPVPGFVGPGPASEALRGNGPTDVQEDSTYVLQDFIHFGSAAQK